MVALDDASVLLLLIFVLGWLAYLLLVRISNRRRQKQWPAYRTWFCLLAVICAVISVSGPIAERAHVDFRYHMLAHLLLGMLAPLLLALATPMTLLLRTIDVFAARRLTRLLRSRPLIFLTHPVVTCLLNVGGLWLLYTTPLYQWMHQSALFYFLIHWHLWLAGYLFTQAMIYLEPPARRYSYPFRAGVLILALAAHGILAKYLYVHPPAGVPTEQAQAGGMLMYYGGDVIDLIIIVLLCQQWYRDTRPRPPLVAADKTNQY